MTSPQRPETALTDQVQGYKPYEPINSLKKVGTDIWVVDGRNVDYRVACLRIPCPTRMTVVRLNNGMVWLHSPIVHDAGLAAAIGRLGPIEFLIAPNTLHHRYIPAWSAMVPEAKIYAPGSLLPSLKPHSAMPLIDQAPRDYGEDIDQFVIELPKFAEAVFFHRSSKTLIVTDLMQSFEQDRFSNRFIANLMKRSGATGPSYEPSIELRFWARRHHPLIVEALERIKAWAPERVVMAHGRLIRNGAAAQVDRAFAWATATKRQSPP